MVLKNFVFPVNILQTLVNLLTAINNIDIGKTLKYIKEFKENLIIWRGQWIKYY